MIDNPRWTEKDRPVEPQQTRVNLLDTYIDKLDMAEASKRIDGFVQSGTPHQIVTVNLDFLRLGVRDRDFRELMNEANLVVADGMPLVWGARLQGDPLPERIAGIDLVCECSRLAAERGYRVFFLGAAPGVAEKAADVLRGRFPGLNVVGTYAPALMNPDDEKVTLALIHAAKPDMLFVALGAPRQDQWIRKHKDTLGVPVCMGVGGTFDMLAGRVSRAPRWMQQAGLEWFHRFAKEPGRLWKRYFVHDLPVFLRLLVWTVATSTPTTPTVPVGVPDIVRADAMVETEPIAG